MRSALLLINLSFFVFTFSAYSQNDSSRVPSVFERIVSDVKKFKPDTSTPPDDKHTRAIRTLMSVRGGFNIQEAISFKIGEDRQEKKAEAAKLDQLENYFKKGRGKLLLENITIWIYRNEFTYKETKQLVRFYRKDVGQKLSHQFPVIMLKSLAAAETLVKEFKSAAK